MKERLKPLSEQEQRLQALNPLLRGYLALNKMSKETQLNGEGRLRVQQEIAETRDIIIKNPLLQAELTNYLNFMEKK